MVARNEHFGNYRVSPTFQELLETKQVVTQGTTRYQMKDMDIIFSMTFMVCKLLLSKSSTWLSKCSKPLESGPFLQKRKNLEVLHFVDRWRDFQTAIYALPIIRKFSILHMNFSLSACILVLFVAIANGHQGHANCKGKYRNTLDLEQH